MRGGAAGRRGFFGLRTQHGERGTVTIESVAIMALVLPALIAALVAGPMGRGTDDDIGDAVRDALCRLLRQPGESCGGDDGTAPPGGGTAPPREGTAPPREGTAPPGGGTAPPDGPAIPPMEDRGLEIACPVETRFTTQSYDMFLPRMFTIAGSRGAQAQQVGPDRFRVSINTENRGGMGTLEGDGPGSRTNEPKPHRNEGLRTGRWGQVTGTLGARAISTYEFESRQEAEDYFDRRHGSAVEGWAGAFIGLPGLAVEDLFRRGQGLYDRLWGWPPPAPEPEPRWTTVGLNARVQGALGYNGGRGFSFETFSGGSLDGTLTFDRGDELIPPPGGGDPRAWIQSGSAEGGLGGMYYPPQSLDRRAPRIPWLGLGGGLGGGLSFRYVSAHSGEPLRLIFITERSRDRFGKLGGGRSDQYVDQDGKGGNRGAGGDVNGRLIDLQVSEYHLDLTDPENLAAFDGVFSRVAPHIVVPPSPRMADNPRMADGQRLAALVDRFQRDGTVARFDFDATGRALGAGAVNARPGGRAKMVGLLAGSIGGHRELQEATFIDNAVPDAQWRALPSCTMPTTGRGAGRDIGSAPGSSPGFGGQSGSP